MPKVGIHNQHPRPCLPDDDAKVEQGRSLPFIGLSAGHKNRLDWLLKAPKVKVGAKIPVGFGKFGAEGVFGKEEAVEFSLVHPFAPVVRRSTRELARGMMPMTGAPIISSTASASSSDLPLRCSRRKARPRPTRSATAPAKSVSGMWFSVLAVATG